MKPFWLAALASLPLVIWSAPAAVAAPMLQPALNAAHDGAIVDVAWRRKKHHARRHARHNKAGWSYVGGKATYTMGGQNYRR